VNKTKNQKRRFGHCLVYAYANLYRNTDMQIQKKIFDEAQNLNFPQKMFVSMGVY